MADLYVLLMDWRGSVGKALLKLRVVRRTDGCPATPLASFVRNLPFVVIGVTFTILLLAAALPPRLFHLMHPLVWRLSNFGQLAVLIIEAYLVKHAPHLRLGDRLAGTRVVRQPVSQPSEAAQVEGERV